MEKKRSLKYLLVSVCLALLVASIGAVLVGATDPIEVDVDLAIHGASLDFNDDVGIAFAIADGVWQDNTVLELYYDNNPGNLPGTPDEVLDSASFVNDAFVRSTENGDVTYDLVISDGFAPKDMHRTVYARLCYNKVEYGPTYKTGALELVHLLKEQVVADPALDEDGVRLGLYNSIIAYADAAREKFFDEPYADYHLVRVEDGYILDNANEKWSYGLYKEGSFINVSPTLDLANSINPDAPYVNYQLAGWSTDGVRIDAAGTTQVRVVNSVTLQPLYRESDNNFRVLQEAANNSTLSGWCDINSNNTLDTDETSAETGGINVTGYYYTLAQLIENAGVAYNNNNFLGTDSSNKGEGIGTHTYIYEKNALSVNGQGKTGSTTKDAYAQVTLDNPTKGAATPLSAVLEFTVEIPSVDADGDGKKNEVSDVYYTSGNNTLFDFTIGYDAGPNYCVNWGSEVLGTLLIITNTSKEGGTVDSWSLGSNAVASNSQNSGNAFSMNNNRPAEARYEFDKEYNIKLVFSPGTYADSTLTMGSSTDLGRIDIYVNDVLHHSRVRGGSTAGSTTSGQTINSTALGIGISNFTRFTNAPSIGMSVNASGNTIAAINVSDIHTYAGVASQHTGESITYSGDDPYTHDGKALYVDRALATASDFVAISDYAMPMYVAEYSKVDGVFSATGIAWNDLAAKTDGIKNRATALGASGHNTVLYRNGDMVSITTAASATGGNGETPMYFANPLAALDEYNGEKLVYEFMVQLPKQDNAGVKDDAHDPNPDGTEGQYVDYVKTGTSIYNLIDFVFMNESHMTNEGSDWNHFSNVLSAVSFRMQLAANSGSATNVNSCNKFGIQRYMNESGEKNTDADKVNIGDWMTVKIVITPNADGTINHADVYLNGKWITLVDDGGAGTATSLPKRFVQNKTNLFDVQYCGIMFFSNANRIGTVNFKGFNCYIAK